MAEFIKRYSWLAVMLYIVLQGHYLIFNDTLYSGGQVWALFALCTFELVISAILYDIRYGDKPLRYEDLPSL